MASGPSLWRLSLIATVALVLSACSLAGPLTGNLFTTRVHVSAADGRNAAEASEVRLMTYNIRWGLGADDELDLDRIAAVLREADADIAVLNEVDVNWRRSGNRRQPELIAAAAGYPYAEFLPSFRFWASGNLRLSSYGNLILSRFPITRTEGHPLPRLRLLREPRAVILAEVRIGAKTLTVLGTHLSLDREERMVQVERLLGLAAARPGPLVLMGDFNARPASPEIRRLLAGDRGLADAHALAGRGPGHTFPADRPQARIDYIFVSSELAPHVTEARTLHTLGSDHLPVLATLSWPPASGE